MFNLTQSSASFWYQNTIQYNAYQNLVRAARHLASGERISTAADNPARLIISEQLRSNIGALNQKIENSTLAIDKYTTADTTITGLRALLIDIRSDALGAVNSVNDAATQTAFHNSVVAAVNAFNDQVANASFGSAKLFDSSAQAVAHIPTLAGIDLSTPERALESLGRLDSFSSQLDVIQENIGATLKYDLTSERASMEITRQNLVAAESQLRDSDLARELISFATFSALEYSAAAVARAHSYIAAQTVLDLFLPRPFGFFR